MTTRNFGAGLIGLCLTLFLLVSASCSAGESTWDRVQRTGVLRVGLDPTYPPFESFDGASLLGIDVDLAEALAAENDLVVEFSHFGFDGLYDALATEQVDVLMSALAPDLSRTRDFAYSDGYIDSGLVLVSPASLTLREAKELAGKSVGVELGAAGHVEATTLQRQVPELTINTYENSDAALDGVVTGEVDAAIVDNISYRLYETPGSSSSLVSISLTSEPYAVVVRREDGQLLAQINQSLNRVRESGELELIINRWLSN